MCTKYKMQKKNKFKYKTGTILFCGIILSRVNPYYKPKVFRPYTFEEHTIRTLPLPSGHLCKFNFICSIIYGLSTKHFNYYSICTLLIYYYYY